MLTAQGLDKLIFANDAPIPELDMPPVRNVSVALKPAGYE
jgi:hypothetical protein